MLEKQKQIRFNLQIGLTVTAIFFLSNHLISEKYTNFYIFTALLVFVSFALRLFNVHCFGEAIVPKTISQLIAEILLDIFLFIVILLSVKEDKNLFLFVSLLSFSHAIFMLFLYRQFQERNWFSILRSLLRNNRTLYDHSLFLVLSFIRFFSSAIFFAIYFNYTEEIYNYSIASEGLLISVFPITELAEGYLRRNKV